MCADFARAAYSDSKAVYSKSARTTRAEDFGGSLKLLDQVEEWNFVGLTNCQKRSTEQRRFQQRKNKQKKCAKRCRFQRGENA